MPFEIKTCLKEYEKMSEKSLQWLSLFWKKEDIFEKQICFLKYQKYKEERRKLAHKLSELSEKYYGHR